MNIRQRLINYRFMLTEMKYLQEQLEEMDAVLYSPKIQRLTGTPGGGGDKRGNENAMLKHAELKKYYRTRLKAMERERISIEKLMEKLPARERMILRFRYLDGREWEWIAVKTSYSVRQASRIAEGAICTLEK